jgi:hypothetical protein
MGVRGPSVLSGCVSVGSLMCTRTMPDPSTKTHDNSRCRRGCQGEYVVLIRVVVDGVSVQDEDVIAGM